VRVAELAPGDVFAGYHVLSQLGEGGMGIVYLAEHIDLGRKVALKLLPPQLASDPRFRERFIRESRTAASLDHPNVIPIYEAGESDGRLFLAMRYVDGTDLARVLHDEGRLDPARAIGILKQVAGALDAAHERGLVHRDVKPANVMLTSVASSGEDEHVYLTDFGLTKRMASESGITDTGQFVGSLDYAAPEQFEGGTLTPATDLYSLGCVLYECLTGEAPYRREQDAAVMYAHLLAPVPKVTEARAELLPGIDQVLARAMAKKPEERYASGAQLITAAADALGLQGERYRLPTGRLRRIVGARKSRRRRKFTLGAVAVAVVVALVALVLPRVVGGGGSALENLPAGMVLLNAKSGKQVGFIPRSAVGTPVEAIFADGHFWVLNLDPLSFVEIDPKVGQILKQIASPVQDVGYYAVDGNTLWVSDFGVPNLVKVDIGVGREVDRFDLSKDEGVQQEGSSGLVLAYGSLWLTMKGAQALRVDPSSGKVQHIFDGVNGSSWGVASGDGVIWTSGDVGMTRIDPETNTVTKASFAGSGYVAAGGGFGWAANESKGVVGKVDQTGRTVATYDTGLGAKVLSFSDGVLWVGNQDVGTATAIDAVTGEQTTYQLSHPVGWVAAGAGVVLLHAAPGRTYEDRIDELTGAVAKLFVPAYQFDPPDPATTGSPLAFEVEYATCAKLLNYPDRPAPQGWQLQPEIAASLPQLSADGRTYAFTVPPGYKFSPPSNQPVSAETFRYSVERALSPKLGDEAPGRFFIGDIEGEQAYLDGKADHISGLRASGDTLSVTLVQPSPDFLQRLSVPFFCPVPTDTSLVAGGVVRHVGGDAGRDVVPSAGPYYIADRLNGEYIILKRNPNYTGPRPHRLDAIALREGVDPGLAVRRVQEEGWNGITDIQDPIFEPEGALASQWGPGSAAARKEGQRFYPVLDGGVLFMEFNANRPLFADRKVREAASLALDRGLLGRLLVDAVPAGDLLASNLPGVPTPGPEPLPAPDLDRARELMGGRTGKGVMSINPPDQCPSCSQVADAVKSELAQIGIDVRINVVPPGTSSFEYAHRPGSRVDLRFAGFNADPYELVVLAHYLSDLTGGFKGWWPADVRKAGERLAGLSGAEFDAGVQSFVAMLKNEAVLAPVAHTILPAYLSPGLGCRVFPPFGYGVDLAAMCLTGASP
jgi:ABC-type transport system substrate-binding protein